MMWFLLTQQVDVNQVADTVLSSEPVVLMITGVLVVSILMAATLIVAMVVAFRLTNKYFDGLDEKRESDEKRKDRELSAQERMASALNSLTGQNDARYKLLQQQIDLMRENKTVGIEARDEAKAAREAVETLQPSVASIEALVKALPVEMRDQLAPIAEGVSGLNALMTETKKAQDEQIATLIKTNEQHNRALQSSVEIIQQSFTGVLAALVGRNGAIEKSTIEKGAI